MPATPLVTVSFVLASFAESPEQQVLQQRRAIEPPLAVEQVALVKEPDQPAGAPMQQPQRVARADIATRYDIEHDYAELLIRAEERIGALRRGGG